MAAANQQLCRVRDRLAGQHVLVTGSTGFLAKVFVEKLLRSVDTIGGIHLLVRPRSDGTSPRQRVTQDVLRSSVFDRLRASLGERFTRLCDEKIHVIGGDLTKERMGIDVAAYDELSRRITLVVNSAATVTFDERLDHAIELNTLGPGRLLQFAKDCGGIPFLHVSTCYVCGTRSGVVVEDFSAPEPARESLPRKADTGEFDLDALIQSMIEESAELHARHGVETESARRQLIDAGMRRARSHGWNDTYTFTKWIGEQLLLRDRGNVPLVIFRPAIIEGSFDEPMPGWIDGLRMADPIIVAYGRGKLNEFPGRPNIAIDLIPVDFVANAMIAALPVGDLRSDDVSVYQCASSDRNPLVLTQLQKSLERAFIHRPMNGDDGRPIRPQPLRIVDRETFLSRWEGKQRAVAKYQGWLKRLSIEGRRFRKLSAQARQIEQVVYFAKIYSPYTHLDCRFADDGLRALAERMHSDDRREFPFDPGQVDWDDYIVNRHVPGLRAFVLGTAAEPSPRMSGVGEHPMGQPTAPAANLFDLFRRSADRFPDKPALQIRRDGRWICYSYDEALLAAGTIMRRFQERGLVAGDRVVICAENGPEWGLTYLAAMRAGLTAVPLDPQLPPAEAWSAARYAKAKLVCAGRTTFAGLREQRVPEDVGLVAMDDALIPPPGASRDLAPDPVPVDRTTVASILFTSGTTVAPKAVPLTHGNFMANAEALLAVHSIGPMDEFLSVLPMYHVFEFTGGFLIPLLRGATITYVEQLKGAEIVSAMQATGTTIMLVVPRLLRMFYDSIENAAAGGGFIRRTAFGTFGRLSDWSGHSLGRRLFGAVHKSFGGRLRMFVCGGSRLEPELFLDFRRMGFTVYEGYGLTETSPVLTLNPPGSPRAGSVGPALPNIELDVRNANLEGIGEVWARGPSVMSGYLDNSDATREVLVDGWLRTGDLGRCDADGYLHLTGRANDLIVTGAGKNVYPDEVEARYAALPFAKELCVFGVPSEDGMGDIVHAVVVVEESASPGLDRSSIEREIRLAAATISETLPTHQRIAKLHFWDRELPMTSTLKAKRGLVRDLVRSERPVVPKSSSDTRPPASPRRVIQVASTLKGVAADWPAHHAAFACVQRILAKQSKRPEHSIHPTMHLLLDLGIDSIGKIDVIGSVEAQFAMRIDDASAAKIARVSDLLHLIGDRNPVGGLRGTDVFKRLLGVGGADLHSANGQLPVPLIPARWLARGTVGVLMNSYIRVEARGRENIPDTGPFILAPNHTSHLDAPSILTAVGGRRRVWTAGAEDYFFNSGLKRFIFGTLFDTIAFDRQADGVVGLRRCSEALAKGDGLLLFPEGTRSLDGRRQPFKIGVAVLAVEQGVPIIPVRIHNAFELFRKGRRLVRPGVITVAFGPPIHPPPRETTADHYAAFHALTNQVQCAVDSLADGVAA